MEDEDNVQCIRTKNNYAFRNKRLGTKLTMSYKLERIPF